MEWLVRHEFDPPVIGDHINWPSQLVDFNISSVCSDLHSVHAWDKNLDVCSKNVCFIIIRGDFYDQFWSSIVPIDPGVPSDGFEGRIGIAQAIHGVQCLSGHCDVRLSIRPDIQGANSDVASEGTDIHRDRPVQFQWLSFWSSRHRAAGHPAQLGQQAGGERQGDNADSMHGMGL